MRTPAVNVPQLVLPFNQYRFRYSEDVQKRSYEPNDDERFQTANKEELEESINLGNLVSIFSLPELIGELIV